METKFEDVAHLYLGCEIHDEDTPTGHVAVLDSVDTGGDCYFNYYDSNGECEHDSQLCSISDVKPILRPLSDMTNDEFYELSELLEECDYEAVFQKYNDGKTGVGYMWQEGMAGLILNSDAGQYFVKIFPFLLSRSFDLFGLIESGEAIDKTKL